LFKHKNNILQKKPFSQYMSLLWGSYWSSFISIES